MKTMKSLIAGALAFTLLFAFTGCKSTDASDTTTKAGTTTPKVTKSSSVKLESANEVKEVSDFSVDTGTSYEDVIAKLPTTVDVYEKAAAPATSETLFSESFDDAAAVAEKWTFVGDLVGDESIISIADGSFKVNVGSQKCKAYVNEQDWMKTGTDEYANYAVKVVMRSPSDTLTNNFGIILRTNDVTGTGADSYYGVYVGIGDAAGIVCVGHAENEWKLINNKYGFGYAPNTDYTLEVIVYNDQMLVTLDGDVAYQGTVPATHVNGGVGLRSFEQLYEVSEFSVRTLNTDDFTKLGVDNTEPKSHPVTWSCTDYDANVKGSYGFFGKVTDMENTATKVIVKVKDPA